MPNPADKTDDLIAELAKLMATAPGGNSAPSVQPIAKPAPLNAAPAAPSSGAPAPTPIRIPGMDAPKPAGPAPAPSSSAPPQPEQRAPSTGTIRIPGMDQPPVSTSAPVGKFDFGVKPAVAPISQEPLSSFTDRLQAGRNLANDPAPRTEPSMAPIRIPSDLKPVSENRSFAEGPALVVAKAPPAPRPASAPAQQAPHLDNAPAPQVEGGDFHFDFGFGENPAQPSPAQSRPAASAPADIDPIAALIEADMADNAAEETDDLHTEAESGAPSRAAQPAVVTPMIRAVGPAPTGRPTMAPVSLAQARQVANAPIPLKPVSVAPRSPDADRFAISPGVGLNMKPSAGQPLQPQLRSPQSAPSHEDSDPMSEIESLIGEAVRVELTPGPIRVQTPQQVAPKVQFERGADLEREIATHPQQGSAPVVPPLTTAFAPRRANLKEDAATASAEDAILAAAAASGAEVGRVDPTIGDESPYRRLKVKPQRSSFLSGGMRQYVGMAVAGTLLLAAGLGLYWVLNMGRTANVNTAAATAPQLTADTTPVKVKPPATQQPATDAASSPVLAKMGGTNAAPSSEQLVSTDQTNGGAVTRDVTPAGDAGENGLANRKVRTVTVRPDGTIVSGDDAMAGGEELSVDRPNVPAVPSTETTSLLGTDTQVAATDPATTADAGAPTALVADPTQPVIDPTAVAPKPITFPVKSATTEPLAFNTTKPANSKVNAVVDGARTPNGQIDLLGGSGTDSQTQQVATAAPAPKVAAPASSGNAAAYVQLSSQPTEGDAQSSLKSMTAKYGSLFGGNKLTIQQVDLGQKGVRWRVRLPAASLGDATSICSQIKAQGGDCFPTKG